MTAIAVVAAEVAPLFTDPGHCEIYSMEAGEDLTAGEVVYITADGTVDLADGNDNDMDEAQFVTLNAGATGQFVDCLRRGAVEGFTVAAVDCGTVVHLSDAVPGGLQYGAGDEPVGRVVLIGGFRVIYFNFQIDADIG